MIAGSIIGIAHYLNSKITRILIIDKEDKQDKVLYTDYCLDILLDDFIWTQSNSIFQTRKINGENIFSDRNLKRIKKQYNDVVSSHAVEFD